MRRVLVVDDEPGVLRVMAVTLRVAGFDADAFEKPAAALAAFERNPDAYGLLVTDLMMPEMSGTDLAYRVLQIRKALHIVFVTGFADRPELPHADLLSKFPVLGKPFQIPMLKFEASRAMRN